MRWVTAWTAAVIAGAAVLGLGGCSAAASSGATGTSCGTTRTAAGVLVTIDVTQGPVDCATALRAEAGYAAAIKAGHLQGNGGGAPARVDGWTCQSYPTTQALRTGNVSECHTANAEVVAVLSRTSTSTSTAGTASTGSASTGTAAR